jgi:hypothetical protein
MMLVSFAGYALRSIKCVRVAAEANRKGCYFQSERPANLLEVNVSGIAALHTTNNNDEMGSWQI